MSRFARTTAALFAVVGAAGTLAACTYVERERPPQQATVVVPAPQPAPTVVTPAPTVTVRPAY